MYGDWTKVAMRATGNSGAYNIVMSHYAYRNVPVGAINAWHNYQQRNDYVVYPMTNPRISARMGHGMFRTVREAGGRAIASDCWDKGFSYDGQGKVIDNSIAGGDAGLSRGVPGWASAVTGRRTTSSTATGT